LLNACLEGELFQASNQYKQCEGTKWFPATWGQMNVVILGLML